MRYQSIANRISMALGQSTVGDLIKVLVLALIYLCVGKVGLSWAQIHISVSAVWPPSGLALAALILWGCRLWPGIFIGALVLNLTTEVTIVTALGMAIGNTLEA